MAHRGAVRTRTRKMNTTLTLSTDLGLIVLRLRRDAAPTTVAHLEKLVEAGLFTGVVFYRSDFVIQTGLQTADGRGVPNPFPALPVNESDLTPRVSNARGTAAFGHWDVPDCGNSDWFINLKANPHLDTAYGGYAVFAQVEDAASFAVVDAIAAAVVAGTKTGVSAMALS
jgi:cyclophilin family peptidyl-prolyl cis-trans isomerase